MGKTTDLTANVWQDKKACRFVVHRRALGVKRKTTVRYGVVRSEAAALVIANKLCCDLKACPEAALAKFRFNREQFRQER